jgi:nucleotidyltransferase substrate binding protein (TIGR01987 family)
MKDVRWKQRFNNYLKAMQTLTDAVALTEERELSTLEQQGLVQSFEFTHELAWNVLKDYLEHKGISGLIGSRDATREAFKNGLIDDGDAWMDMIRARNLSSHTYNRNTAEDLVEAILLRYYPAFEIMSKKFTLLHEQND